ncbi:MBL fold hydrolase [Polymorphobacter glacialis]|uniref:MBL fold hydrolase n=1 Tax=Sandarakinorhabdus glacialis TaxID=1614636 RepID=A0A917E5W3_9SPHN|nr:ribonuclease J [Polymorphobacter glacialis]GGE07818.1 MBL fold hydrolase [Polymorphobacter glacialis]
MKPGKELIFLPLGGSGEIGMNVNLYGCNGKWVMVDLGMTFADPSYPGVDLVLPDLSFIEDRAKDLLGVVLTHGHEDHIGAIPYLANDLGVPLYATPFTAGLIAKKLEEEGLTKEVKLNIIPMGGTLQLGDFHFRYVALAHSIPEGNALVIDTPYGRVFHTGDWKLDDGPLLGTPASAAELTAIGDSGVLAMVGDSTNVFNNEASGSETDVREGLLKVVKARKTGRVVVTTFASNAARLATLGYVAKETGRHLVLAGRSMDRITQVAKATGYLKDMPPTLSWEAARNMDPSKILILCTGAQGEPMAALSRIANGSHPVLKLEKGDVVVYSSKQIPGNELAIGHVQNALATRGIEVITEKQAHVHVSGHPGRPELEAMYDWIRPEIAIPVHGERRHMEAHAALALEAGVPRAMVPVNGACIRLAPNGPTLLSHEKAGRLILDGDVILPADGITIVERRRLMMNGHMGVTVVLDRDGRVAAKPTVTAQGVPVEEDKADFLSQCADAAETVARKADAKNHEKYAEAVRVAVRRIAREWTGKKPVTDVQVVRL